MPIGPTDVFGHELPPDVENIESPKYIGEHGDFYLYRKPDGSTLRVPKPVMAPPSYVNQPMREDGTTRVLPQAQLSAPAVNGSRVPVARDSDPQSGLVIEYYDDPNKMSPAMRPMVADKVQAASAPGPDPVAELAKKYPNLAALAHRHRK